MSWQHVVETAVTGLGYELVDAEKSAGGLLRVFIDRPVVSASPESEMQHFITVDDCEKVTRQLQHVLEVEGCAYQRLEVSSPGLDRPLKKLADYQRFSGAQIELTLKLPFQGRKKYCGELQAREDGWCLILAADKAAAATAQVLDFAITEVREARLVPVVDFKGLRRAAMQNGASQSPKAKAAIENKIDGGRTV